MELTRTQFDVLAFLEQENNNTADKKPFTQRGIARFISVGTSALILALVVTGTFLHLSHKNNAANIARVQQLEQHLIQVTHRAEVVEAATAEKETAPEIEKEPMPKFEPEPIAIEPIAAEPPCQEADQN